MKIAFLIPSLKGGGAERFAANVTNKLCENAENTIYLLTGAKKDGEYELNKNTKRVFLLKGNLFMDIFNVRRFLNSNAIDVCVGIDIYANILLSMISFSIRTTTVLSERTAPNHMPYSKITKLLRNLFFKQADYYIFQTEEAKQFYPELIRKRSVVIPNPVKEGLPKREEPFHKEIVAVGRLDKVKNYDMLLKAFRAVCDRHPDYILRIFGDGNQKEHLLNLCKKLGLEKKVRFEGFFSDVHSQIVHSEIFIMTSDLEGMPNSLLEAMYMGFPVISTDCPAGAPREMIGENKNGLLVPVGDVGALTDAICKLIGDKELRKSLGMNAEKKSEDYSIDIIKGKWEKNLTKMRVGRRN